MPLHVLENPAHTIILVSVRNYLKFNYLQDVFIDDPLAIWRKQNSNSNKNLQRCIVIVYREQFHLLSFININLNLTSMFKYFIHNF